MDIQSILQILEKYGILGLIIIFCFCVIIVFIRILLDEDKSALWRGKFYRAVYWASKKREHEKKYISNDIKGRLNLARKELHFGKSILPEAIDIEWIEGAEGQTYNIKDGEYFIKLDPANEQNKNIITLATSIVRKTTLSGVRSLLEEELEVVIDMNLIKELLAKIKNRDVMDWFFSNVYDNSAKKNDKGKEWNHKITIINEKGLFLRILLLELDDFSFRIHGKEIRPYMIGEVEGLIEFLYRIANKQYGQDVPLDYTCAIMRLGVILIADTSKILYEKEGPYIQAALIKIENEVDSFYVISFDKEALGYNSPESQQEIKETIKIIHEQILNYSQIKKDFDSEYYCIDSFGNRRKVRFTRFLISHD